eukprot:scaffold28937_cov25-Phaeocystis_antarctica.AAC.1
MAAAQIHRHLPPARLMAKKMLAAEELEVLAAETAAEAAAAAAAAEAAAMAVATGAAGGGGRVAADAADAVRTTSFEATQGRWLTFKMSVGAKKAKREAKVVAQTAAKASREVTAEAAAVVVLKLVRAARLARARALKLRYSDPRSADDQQALFARLQLAAAACVQNDEFGKAREDSLVRELFNSNSGREALELAVQIKAKGLLAQPMVQRYINFTWR